MYAYGLFESHFSPIQTYNNKGDKYAAFYKRVEDKNGNNYYVSFPPFSFLFPTIIFKIIHIPPSKFILQIFNLVIHFISAILVFLIILNADSKRKTDFFNGKNKLFLGAIIAYIFYLLSPVMLFFHTEVFSCETFSRPLWLAGILISFKIFNQNSKIKKIDLFLISLITFLLTYSEWLGIFFGTAVLIIAFIKIREFKKNQFSDVFAPSLKGETSENSPPFRVRGKVNFQLSEVSIKTNSYYLKLIKCILLSVLFSLALMVVQYSSINGFYDFIHSLFIRFVERSGYFGERLSSMHISIFNLQSYKLFFENYNSALFGFGYLTIALLLFLIITKKVKLNFTLSPINVLFILSVFPTLIHSIIFFNANVIHLECFSRISVPFSIMLGISANKFFINFRNKYIKFLLLFVILMLVYFSKIRFDKYYDEKFNAQFINKTANFIKYNSSGEDVIFVNIQTSCPAPYLYLIYKTKRNIISVEYYKQANEKFLAIPQSNGKYFEFTENKENYSVRSIKK
jgi:hypothetical protein